MVPSTQWCVHSGAPRPTATAAGADPAEAEAGGIHFDYIDATNACLENSLVVLLLLLQPMLKTEESTLLTHHRYLGQ